MKTRNQLITSAYALVMVLALLSCSLATVAGSESMAAAPGSPTGPEPVLTITQPITGDNNNTGTVIAKWTVVANRTSELASIWNHTRLYALGAAPGAFYNDTKNSSHTYSGLAEGQFVFEAMAVYWNATAGAYQNSTAKTVLFRVDMTKPTMTIESPVDGSKTNMTNFTAAWTPAQGAGAAITSVRGQMTNVTGGFTYPWVTVTTHGAPYWVTNFTELDELEVGSWSLQMEVTDGAGNVGNYWSNFTVTPYVTFVWPDEYVDQVNFTVSWTTSLIDGTTLTGYEVSLYNDTDSYWFDDNETVTVPEIWLHNVSNGADVVNGKTYIVSVNVTASDGSYDVTSQTFTVDTTDPAVFWVTPANDTLWNNNSMAVQWSADGGDSPIVWSNLTLTNSTLHSEYLDLFTAANTTTLSAIWGAAVPDGDYVLKVVVHDGAGNTAQAMTNFTVDATAPAINIASPVDGSYTQLTNFTASWTISDAAGSGVVGSWARVINETGVAKPWVAISTTGSQWITNFTSKQLLTAEGDWAFEIAAIDLAGNNVSVVSDFTIDYTDPVVSIAVPGAYANQANFTAEWSAADPSPIAAYAVRLRNVTGNHTYADVAVGTDLMGWIVNFTDGEGLAEGVWWITVFATDAAGNQGSLTSAFTVDLTAPEVSVTFPAADGAGVASKDVNVTWNGTDALSGIASYNVSMDGAWTVLGNVGYFEYVNLSEGSHTFVVVAFDMAGNSQTATRTFIVDVTAPEVSITFPAEGQFFNVDSINATWTMNDTNLDHADVDVDGSVSSVGLNTSFLMSGLIDGPHTFTVTVYDIAGNSNTTNVTFFIDKSSPVIIITFPLDGGFYNVTNMTTTWLVSDPPPSSGIAYYEVWLDGGAVTNVGLNVSYNLTGLTEGVHTFSVKAYDNATNNFTTSNSFTIDLTKPEVTITAPAEGAQFGLADIFVSWTATDASGIDHFEAMVDGGIWMPMALALNDTFMGLGDGAHIVVVKAVDVAGNYNVTQIGFVTDVTSPYVVITEPAADAMFGVNSVTANFTAVDNTTGVSLVQMWMDSGAPVNVTGAYTFIDVSEGAHVIHVKAWDAVGNWQEKTVSILMDFTAPVIAISAPTAGQFLNSGTVNAQFTATDPASGVAVTKVKIDSGSWIDVTGNISHAFTGVTNGQHTIYVFSEDVTGNNDTKSVTFTVDLVAPTITVHDPTTGENGVLKDANIVITFSEPMLRSSLTVVLSPAISGVISWNADNTTATFNPGTDMAYATQYSATVSGTDRAGNALSGTATWNFRTIAIVTGIVKDPKGNAIANATVNITDGVQWYTGKTNPNGAFSIEAPIGHYNATISASGMKEYKKEIDVVAGSTANNLGDLGMTAVDDWTWLIIVVIIVIAVLLLFLFMRKKGMMPGKKAAEPKKAEAPKKEEPKSGKK